MGRRKKPDPPGVNQTAMRNAERYYKQHDDFKIIDTSILLDQIRIDHDAFHDSLSICHYKEYPGIYLIKNAIKIHHQQAIVTECLKEAKAPNVTNLDTHYEIPDCGIWKLALQDPRSLINLRPDNENAIIENDGRKIDPPTSARPFLSSISSKNALRRLRWTSLGVQCMFIFFKLRSLGYKRISF